MITTLQNYLRREDGQTTDQKLAELVAKYSLSIKPHGKYPHLWQFKYDQINSPMNEPLVQECRGIILDANDNWACVARPFDKFFNLGDFYAAKIDWATARITEKLDGSLIILYHYDGRWHVATSGTPDASGNVYGYDMTFAQLFWQVFDKMGMSTEQLDLPYDTEYTYLFELTTPFNRIVVPHHESKVTLIGIRNKNNGNEIPPAFGPKEWPYVKAISVASEQAVLDTFVAMSAIEQEGWVLVDEDFNRVKVKHPQYIVLHHMRGEGNPSPKKALEVILAGEHEEVLTYWPEWRPLFQEVSQRFTTLVEQLTLRYDLIKGIEPQKAFALEAIKTRCSGALFCLRAGKTPDIRTYLANMKVDNVVSMLELQNIHPDIIATAVKDTLNRKAANTDTETAEAAA